MLPILYSFRRCPYAIRARLAIKYSGIAVELREVVLADKPGEMLDASPKGTVPVLILDDGTILDESLDIIEWALSINDPDNWRAMDPAHSRDSQHLIDYNDGEFKQHLDHYKYAVRFPDHPAEYYRQQACEFLNLLNTKLQEHRFLSGKSLTLTDIAVFPFIRQFAFVDKPWFDSSEYRNLQSWLEVMLQMPLFSEVMQKYPKWQPGDETVLF
ncbi:glutathione S-transferase [Kaarinaea lacus]